MSTPTPMLDRFDGRLLATGISVLFAPLAFGVIWLSGQSLTAMLLFGLPLAAGGAVLAGRINGGLGDTLIASMLIAQACLLTVQFAGHPWQTDTYVIFFALLAIISTQRRVRALILACALTSAFLLAAAFYWPTPGLPLVESRAALLQGGLHLALVVLEGGVLAVAILQRRKAREQIEQAAIRLETERRMAADAQAEAESAQRVSQEVIDEVRIALSRLSGRDMTCSIARPFPQTYEIMREDFNTTVETLRDAFLNASDLAGVFTAEAQVLAQEMIDMSGRSDQQAKHLQEMTGSSANLLDRLAKTVEQAGQAAASAGQARTSAERIDAVTTQAVTAMRGIEDSSRQISRIVDLIDDVSFQTNLLALNAGVEAARAGPSGKGFAVVATEVRHLAQSTSEAAAGIRKLITHSSQQVKTGAELVDAVGHSVTEIQEKAAQASEVTQAISTRNADLIAALQELNAAICDADRQFGVAAETGRTLAARSRKMTIASKKLSCDIQAFTFTEDDLRRGMSEA
ncbi:methyl-accepting chemotaxis protein [Antarctobacter heliothermus]|uniref:Methyl-accepting chemotaxis protein n=1 Tax=Antarctobacter heliothermus TaxID=74033 RepID=A0A239FQE0_9RHOB|nr:methyl-accepting chemotaxis protein [Antarctobacter heliothermus]SNS58433.1 methyl-accepting chemotaxis protein [Antarctobacter heliothermus]